MAKGIGDAERQLQETLSPLSSRMRAEAPVIRSVSQANFELQGEAAFETAVRETAKWMRRRNNAIPTQALDGQPFEVGGGGVQPAQSVALKFVGGRAWAASLDYADNNVVGRTWVTEITIAEGGGKVLFGTRLVNVTRGFDPTFVPSLPGIIRQLLTTTHAVADEVTLTESATRADSADEIDDIIALIDDPKRRLSVVVVADALGQGRALPATALARRLAGAAHVFSLSTGGAWELTRRFGKKLSVFDGAARLYRPGFQSALSDPFEHPLWMARPGIEEDTREDSIVARVLSGAVNTGRRDDYPRFNLVRQAASADAIAAVRQTSSDAELSRIFEAENQRLDSELKSLRAEFDQWLDDADHERSESARIIDELKTDVSNYRAQVESLRAALATGQRGTNRQPLLEYETFEDWAARNVSSNVWFAPKAIREIEKNGQFDSPGLIGDAINMMDDLYVPMRRNPGTEAAAAFAERLEELSCEDQACFKEKNNTKAFPEYSVTYRGEKFLCERHIKHGGGTDPRRYFRIYYHWHDEDRIILVGHLPSHLDNKLTN